MMAYDYSKLNGRIVEKFGSQSKFAAAMNISEHTMSKKLNNAVHWKQTEISQACSLLEIEAEDIPAYFFRLEVQSA